MHTTIHLFNGHILTPSYVIGIILGDGGTAGNKIDISCCHGACIPTREPDPKEPTLKKNKN